MIFQSDYIFSNFYLVDDKMGGEKHTHTYFNEKSQLHRKSTLLNLKINTETLWQRLNWQSAQDNQDVQRQNWNLLQLNISQQRR